MDQKRQDYGDFENLKRVKKGKFIIIGKSMLLWVTRRLSLVFPRGGIHLRKRQRDACCELLSVRLYHMRMNV